MSKALVFGVRSRNPEESVLTYALARLENVLITPLAWDTFQDLLFQCVTVEPPAMRPAIALLHKYQSRGISPRLDDVIHKTIDRHGGTVQGSDVAWALWAAIVFNRSIPDVVAQLLDKQTDSVVALLALYARSIGLIDSTVKFPSWEASLNVDGLYGREWLLAYEANIKGWLLPSSVANYVDSDPFFGELKRNGVSFYDTSALSTSVTPAGGRTNY